MPQVDALFRLRNAGAMRKDEMRSMTNRDVCCLLRSSRSPRHGSASDHGFDAVIAGVARPARVRSPGCLVKGGDADQPSSLGPRHALMVLCSRRCWPRWRMSSQVDSVKPEREVWIPTRSSCKHSACSEKCGHTDRPTCRGTVERRGEVARYKETAETTHLACAPACRCRIFAAVLDTLRDHNFVYCSLKKSSSTNACQLFIPLPHD